MVFLTRRLAVASIMLILVLGAVGTTFAQDGTPPPEPTPAPACVPDPATACAKIVFYPATLKADLFLGAAEAAQPTAQVQQSTLWVTFASPAPGQTIDVVVKNIHDGGKDEGALYQYPDIPRTVNVPFAAGQTSTVTLFPVKKYIRGKIDAKCSPLSVLAGEDVACIVSIDGVVQTIPAVVPATPPTPLPDGSLPPAPGPTATLAAGQKTTFIVEPGKHDVKFDLTGANASLWAPASQTKTVTVSAGTFAQVATATFNKAGHIVAKLAQAEAGWVGDFYLDGTLIASQVGGIDQWVEGNKTHKVEVKNIALFGAPLIRPYYDGTSSAYVTAGGTSNLTVTMTKVPESVMKTPDFDGQTVSLSTDDYAAWYPVISASTAELAEENANHYFLSITLDGVFIGDVSGYRRPAHLSTSASSCGAPAHAPCYTVGWFVPLGKLAAGQHVLHAESATFTSDFFDGWDTIYAGYYAVWPDDVFMVNAPAP